MQYKSTEQNYNQQWPLVKRKDALPKTLCFVSRHANGHQSVHGQASNAQEVSQIASALRLLYRLYRLAMSALRITVNHGFFRWSRSEKFRPQGVASQEAESSAKAQCWDLQKFHAGAAMTPWPHDPLTCLGFLHVSTPSAADSLSDGKITCPDGFTLVSPFHQAMFFPAGFFFFFVSSICYFLLFFPNFFHNFFLIAIFYCWFTSVLFLSDPTFTS